MRITDISNNYVDCVCPICRNYTFKIAYDVCEICFWENDPIQHNDPKLSGGANNLCLYDYQKWWNKLNGIMPALMRKFNITNSHLSNWAYDELIVPRENLKEFVDTLSKNNIEITLSYYHVCEKYGFDNDTFVGYPVNIEKTVTDANNDAINIVFSDNPIKVCEKYKMRQLLKVLNESENCLDTWQSITPYICVAANPKQI